MKTNATLIGTAIGDALGMPFEMKRHDYKPLVEWDGSYQDSDTFHKLKKGQVTDDTQFSCAVATILIRYGSYIPDYVAREFVTLYNSEHFRGMGNTTRKALDNLVSGKRWDESGMVGEDVTGNGTAMRAAPIGILYRNNLDSVIEAAQQDAMITHNAYEPEVGSMAVAVSTALLASGTSDKSRLITMLLPHLPNSAVKQNIVVAQRMLKEAIPSSLALRLLGMRGYVVETVASAIYCFVKGESFQESVVMAVKGGGDADTVAAISGALAGTYYGLERIPEQYKLGVENHEELIRMDSELFNRLVTI